jgi:nitrogen regulatory protein PII
MKKIEAIILPSRLDAVKAELERRGIHAALTLTEVQQVDGHKASVSAEKETAGSLEDRVKVELIVGDRQAQKAVDIIMQYAQVATNEAAGHVALLRVNEALQIVPPLSKN